MIAISSVHRSPRHPNRFQGLSHLQPGVARPEPLRDAWRAFTQRVDLGAGIPVFTGGVFVMVESVDPSSTGVNERRD